MLSIRFAMRALPALMMVLFVAACSRNAEPESSNTVTEVIVIAAEAIAEPPVPEQNADAQAEYPEDPTDDEAPHPSGGSPNSSVGLGGGSGGGGFGYRRARGGGSSAAGSEKEPDPAALGVKWAEGADSASLQARRGSENIGNFPLKRTSVHVKVSGPLAGTTVTQTFENMYTEVIEAIYTFPLPGDSAINQFVMQVGERKVIGVVKPRAEAVKAYNEAKARGQTATLMTQNRPNVFTQNVANIEAGGSVKISLTFHQTLRYDNGRFEYVFPLTLGPRYKSAAPDTDKDDLDDPEDFDVKALPPGMRSGIDVDLEVNIDSGLPIDITRLQSVAHEVDVELTREERAVVRLKQAESIADRDFVLRWGIAGDKPAVGLLTHKDARGGWLNLQVQPQLDPRDADVTPREITFILDVSGSMSGEPSRMSREVIRKTLDHLHPDDIFNIVYFASGNEQLFERPMPNKPENVTAAKEFLGKVRAGGGTEMLAGLQRALKAEHEPQHLQMYAFLTDGYISGEDHIFRTIQDDGRNARFFAFGIGNGVNRHLLDGIAEHGNGKAIYCLPRDGNYAEGAVQEFYSAIDMPVLCDIEVDWNGLEVTDVYPANLNDLFAAQPLALQARFSGKGNRTININGRVGARRVSIPVELNLDAPADNPAIATIWARAKIAQLSSDALASPDDRTLTDAITTTALEFNLMSRYTSFIAVDESRIVGDGRPMRVWQPVEMPEGLISGSDHQPAAQSRVYEIEVWGLTVGETEGGRVLVLKVKDGTPAAESGMKPGQVIERIGGLVVSGIERLEELLLQSKAKIELDTSLTDEGVRVEAKFSLPEIK